MHQLRCTANPDPKGKMKKTKWILIGLGVMVLLAAILMLPMVITMMSFAPEPTGAVTEEFYAIRDSFVNVFLLESGDDLICFDAGNNPENVEAGIRELGLDPLKVRAVFLTHSDGDHVNGLPVFKNAVVYLPEMEEPLVTGAAKRHFLFMSRVNSLPVEKYTIIKDEETVAIGGATVTAYLTPGHTIGSTSYLANGKYLSVGDLAITRNGRLIGMPKPPSEDLAVLESSLKQIAGIKGVAYIATAHGGVVRVNN
jgi:glyoxylase-like metal-dependent hydrolase (beta-lactamase superfamily II)